MQINFSGKLPILFDFTIYFTEFRKLDYKSVVFYVQIVAQYKYSIISLDLTHPIRSHFQQIQIHNKSHSDHGQDHDQDQKTFGLV